MFAQGFLRTGSRSTLRKPVFTFTTRHASSAARQPAFFARNPPRIPLNARRTALWLVPLAGGLTLYLLPHPTSLFPAIFASPHLIPCPPTREPLQLNSPREPQLSIPWRILHILRDWIWEPILTGRRFLFLSIIFLPVIITSPMLFIGDPDSKYNGDRWGAVWWYGFLVAQMNRAGPTFIKLSQWAGSRTDLFPPILCERLSALHSRGNPHSLRYTKHVVQRVFHRKFEDVFEEFDETPIGVGAVAQVYRATLKKDLVPPSYISPKRQRKKITDSLAPTVLPDPPPVVPTATVAVKILHPKVTKLISRDLAIMSFFAGFITLFPGMEWLSLPEEVDVFGRMMYEQVDLRNEAENLVRFEENFGRRKDPVTFPRPMKDWSTRDILIEEYQNALPLETFLKIGGGPFDDELAEMGLDAFLNMLLLDNFVHSDLHPGNIMVKFCRPSTRLVLKDIWAHLFTSAPAQAQDTFTNSESDAIVTRMRALQHDRQAWHAELAALDAQGYIPEVVFIDAGLVVTLDEANRRNFLDLFRAIAEFDGYRAGELMVERCRMPSLVREPETFALKMQHLVLSVKRKTFSLGQIKISDVLTEVLKAVRVHHVKMEGDFVNTVISILLLEGIGRQLDPGLDLFKSAVPILRQLGKQMASEGEIQKVDTQNLGAMLKVYLYLEARGLASAAFVDVDEQVRCGTLVPTV